MKMEFEWDDQKEADNVRKHDVQFSLAIRVFFDVARKTEEDSRFVYDETRFVTIGQVYGRFYTVVHTERGIVTRIISARRATAQEKRSYGNSSRNH